MGKFSDRINKTLGRRKEPIENWDRIGNALALASQLVAYGPERVLGGFVLARKDDLGTYEADLADLTEQFKLLRESAQAQLEVADAVLKIINDSSRMADALLCPADEVLGFRRSLLSLRGRRRCDPFES